MSRFQAPTTNAEAQRPTAAAAWLTSGRDVVTSVSKTAALSMSALRPSPHSQPVACPSPPNPVLSDHVCHPQLRGDTHQLHGAEPQVVATALPMPGPAGGLRLGRAT